MVDIFKYSEPHTFLKDAWAAKKAKNPSFSMRSWSKKLGFGNNSPLSLMLAGKRPIPKKYVPSFAADLELGPRESQYLDALVDLGNAHDPKEREYHWPRMQAISPVAPLQVLELEHFKFLGDPIHTCILEMIDLKGFKHDPAWIRDHLTFPASLDRIDEALDRLAALGLVRQVGNRLEKCQKHLSSRSDVVDEGGQQYHQNVSRLAAEMVRTQPLAEREFNAYALNVSPESMPKAKQLLREFVERFIREVEAAPGEGQRTYQLNLQFFGLADVKGRTKAKRKKGDGQ
jgi:uncharacterized protein (TIGR02147 family)